MHEYPASRFRIARFAATALLLFALPAILINDLPVAMRVMGALLAVVCFGAAVMAGRTRIVVAPDAIAIYRGFGTWFRAAPGDVEIRWMPLPSGPGRGHALSLVVVRKDCPADGVQVALHLWRPETIEALRTRLAEVTAAPRQTS